MTQHTLNGDTRRFRGAMGGLALLVGTAACGTGLISGPSGAGGELVSNGVGPDGTEEDMVVTAAPASFACDGDASPVESPHLRRLSARQYTLSLRDWLTEVLGNVADANAVMGDKLATIPEDIRIAPDAYLAGEFKRLDQNVADVHVSNWFKVGVAIGTALSQPPYLERAFGSCATDGDSSNDADCVDDFIRTHAPRLLRKKLDDQTVAFYRGFYGDTSAPTDVRGFADVVGGLLNAPSFLYVVEHGRSPTGEATGTHDLSATELASRLALHFWDTLPDDELWAAAEDGSLLQASVYEAQVDRLFRSNKTKNAIREFYRDWLQLDDLPDMSLKNGFPDFEAFAGGDLPSAQLHVQMVDEVLDSLAYHTWTQDDGVEQLLFDNHSFARDEELATIYGVPVWNGEGTPPEFEHEDRLGLLTRAAMVATGLPNTRPIHKGVFIRRNLLCDVLPPPPNNAAAMIPDISQELSTREVVEELTQVEGSACAGCHTNYINGLGFATEMFDGLGRFRTDEPLFDSDGNQVGTASVDTRSTPRVNLADSTEVDGPEGLAEKILDSGKVEACMARLYFRFSMGRGEDLQGDGCALEALRTTLADNASLADMLKAVALDPAFKRRTFGS